MARLLVVDDERDICDLVVKRLERVGHEVMSADSGPTALSLVHRLGAPDAAILDIDMPGMDGLDLLARLREQCPGLPAMFLTVLWAADVHRLLRSADVSYVAKPFTTASLLAGVGQLLGGAGDGGTEHRSDP